MSRYDEVVKALLDLGGRAKLDVIHKKCVENNPQKPPSKDTVSKTLGDNKEPKKGGKYSFRPLGKGI